MTRRRIGLWPRLFPTSAPAFLKTPDGARLLDLLTEWWIDGEGVLTGAAMDHRGRAVAARYDRARCYAMLDRAGYPELADRDEPALDSVHHAFLTWAMSRKARALVTRLADQATARDEIQQAVQRSEQDRTRGYLAPITEGHESMHRHVQDSVQQHVHASVHQHVHDSVHQQVHHAVHQQVHHAVHHATATHHAGGAHGGHH